MSKKIKCCLSMVLMCVLAFNLQFNVVLAADNNETFNLQDDSEEHFITKDEIIASVGEEIYQKALEQADAVEAYNYFVKQVLRNRYGTLSYPSGYAGEYIEGDKLILQATDDQQLEFIRRY